MKAQMLANNIEINPGRSLWQLIARWLAGEANASDLLELYTRTREDAELHRSLETLERIWVRPGVKDSESEKTERLLVHRIRQRCIYLGGM